MICRVLFWGLDHTLNVVENIEHLPEWSNDLAPSQGVYSKHIHLRSLPAFNSFDCISLKYIIAEQHGSFIQIFA